MSRDREEWLRCLVHPVGDWHTGVVRGQAVRIRDGLVEVRSGPHEVVQRYRQADLLAALDVHPGLPMQRPFPWKPTGSGPQLFHVEEVDAAQVVVLFYPEHIRTVHAEEGEFSKATWVSGTLPVRMYTLRLPPLLYVGLLVNRCVTPFRGAFAITDSSPRLATELFMPPLQNVSVNAYSQVLWMCMDYLFSADARAQHTVVQHAARVNESMWQEAFTWSSDAHEGLSAFRHYQTWTEDARLRSYEVWEQASLSGVDLWKNQPLPHLNGLTLGKQIETLLTRGNVLTRSLPHKLRTCLSEVLGSLTPIEEEVAL